MDRTGANFIKVYEQIKDRLRAPAIPIQLPIGSEDNFRGIVDLVTMKASIYEDDLGQKIQVTDVPDEVKDLAEKYRGYLLETIAELDENLLDKYLSEAEITETEIKAVIRQGTISGQLVPLLCGSAFKNKGVQLLLDAVVDYLPAPTEVPAIKGILPNGEEGVRHSDDQESFSALAFKIASDPFGRLTFVRVYSGVLTKGSYVYNATQEKKERISRLIILKANDRIEVEELRAGDLGAIIGLKKTMTGDTLCDEKNPILLESLFIPEPVISVAV
jgi:elongation factor G